MAPCATRSASQYPGGGDPQSLNVRTGTCRRTTLETPARRRRPPVAAIFTLLSRRSIVAALTFNTSDRSSTESFNLPCRSSAGSKNGIVATSRLLQSRSERPIAQSVQREWKHRRSGLAAPVRPILMRRSLLVLGSRACDAIHVTAQSSSRIRPFSSRPPAR